MKTLRHFFGLTAIITMLTSAAFAQYAPSSLDYAVWKGTISQATLPFAGVGSTTNVAFTLGNYLSFDATGQAGSGAVGTYTYTQTGLNTASLVVVRTNISPTFTSIQNYTFTSVNGGVFTTTGSYNGYSGSAQGTFTLTILQPQSVSTTHLVNLSSRAAVGIDGNILIAGFIVGGSGNETVLVRGIGPTLGTFGLSGVLAQPVLTVYDSSGKVIASDQGWQNPPSVPAGASAVNASPANASHATFSKVGAFDLSDGSADSALVLTLPSGSYTAQISGLNKTTGVALIEVYEDN